MTGQQLRKRRQALRGRSGAPLSLQELATDAGIGIGTLHRYETKQPRTELRQRGLDPVRIGMIETTLERLELKAAGH